MMKRLVFLMILALALVVVPAFGQDDGDNSSTGGGFEDLFGDDVGGGAARAKKDPLLDLRALLLRAKAPPLEKKQEGPLTKIYEKEVKAMTKDFEKEFGISVEVAIAALNPAFGRRGTTATSPQQAAAIRRLQRQVLDRVIAGLRLDQQGILRRYQSDQIRISRLRTVIEGMVDARMPLTAAQKTQIEALFERESQLRALIIVEAKGQSYDFKVAQLETQTTQRVVSVLEPPQRTAHLETLAKLRLR
jgi:hypothetical protein